MKIRCETPHTKDLTAEQADKVNRWQRRVYLMLSHAAADGVVITVDNPPNTPPAMGNYDLVVKARVLRGSK